MVYWKTAEQPFYGDLNKQQALEEFAKIFVKEPLIGRLKSGLTGIQMHAAPTFSEVSDLLAEYWRRICIWMRMLISLKSHRNGFGVRYWAFCMVTTPLKRRQIQWQNMTSLRSTGNCRKRIRTSQTGVIRQVFIKRK